MRIAFDQANPAPHRVAVETGETPAFTGSMPPSHLLLPVDFSTCTRPAIQYTLRIAAAFDAHTTILAMNPPPWIHVLADASVKPERDETDGQRSRRFVRRLLTSLGIDHDGRQVRLLIRTGDPVRETIFVATENGTGMVILAGLEKRAFDIITGGTAENVARAVHCPVLTIRQDVLVPRVASELSEDATPWKDILAAVNFSPGGRTVLGCVSQLAQTTLSRPTLLHVVESHPSTIENRLSNSRHSPEPAHDRAARQLEEWSDEFVWPETPRHLVQAGVPVHEVLTHMTARLESDLLVTGMRRCNRMQHIVSDDTAAQVIGSAPCPVLVVPESGK